MEWLNENKILAGAATAVGALVVLWKIGFLKWFLSVPVTLYRVWYENALRIALRDCEAHKQARAELRDDLRQSERKLLAYGDINIQDRATIRTLVAKIDDHNKAHLVLHDERLCLIDYSDLHEEIERSLLS